MQDFKHGLKIGVGLVTRPLHFTTQDWMHLGVAAGATGMLMFADKRVREFALQNQNPLNDRSFNWDHYQGNQYSLLLPLGIYGWGLSTGNSKLRQLGLRTGEAFFYSGVLTTLLKVLIGRRRPYAGEDQLYFKPFQFLNDDFKSLPSGHTTVSFAVSTVLAKSRDNPYWKLFWYGTASMVGASRIYHNKHWLSDVFLGGCIGYAVGSFVSHHGTEVSAGYSWSTRFHPGIMGNGVGLTIDLDRGK